MMNRCCFELCGQVTELVYPASIQTDIDVFFGAIAQVQAKTSSWVNVEQIDPATFELTSSIDSKPVSLARYDLPAFLMDAVITALITDQESALVLHAGSVVHDDKAIIIAGVSGAGKSVLTALMVEYGFGYLTDELVLLDPKDSSVSTLPRALTLRQESLKGLPTEGILSSLSPVEGSGRSLFPVPIAPTSQPLQPGMLIFPRFEAGSDLRISTMTAAESASRLLQGNLNAKNLPAGGLPIVSRMARNTPAIDLRYGQSEQLEGVIEPFIHQVFEENMSAKECRHYFSAFSHTQKEQRPSATPPAETERELLPATEPRGKHKLTIGMATFDDFDGVYFSVQALRLYHAELMDDVEILVIDNNPAGACAVPLKRLEHDFKSYRYIPYNGHSGTAVRDVVFAEASGDFVLLMDCHVLLPPGVLGQLMSYLDDNPTTTNLLQGPMITDDLKVYGTHFKPEWSAGMYGCWGKNEEAVDPAAEPFEIPMQGLGLFVCRKDAWAWFNPNCRGFGGEEGYIHEKFRQRGDKTLCLPFLQWLHRFPRPMGIPYRPIWEDRIRNYVLGWQELGLDQQDMRDHFSDEVGSEQAKRIFKEIDTELKNPFWHFEAIRCINLIQRKDRHKDMRRRFKRLGIERRATFWPAVETPDNHHVGCALSHRQIIEDAKRRGLDNVLVFEDDAIFHQDILQLLPAVIEELQNVDWQILSFGGHKWGKVFDLAPECQTLEIANGMTSAHAIVYHSSVFDRLLAELPDNLDEMEEWVKTKRAIDNMFAIGDYRQIVTRPVLATQIELIPVEDPEARESFVI